MSTPAKVILDGNSLTIEQTASVARGGDNTGSAYATVSLSGEAKKNVARCRALVVRMVAEDRLVYGVTTGIGEFARIKVSPAQAEELQKRIVHSHSASVGDEMPIPWVRANILLRANTLAKGHSGIRLEVLQTMLEMLNTGVTPVVYKRGSLGASGDLSPMSMIGEVVMGGGQAYFRGRKMKGSAALKKAELSPWKLSYKEGLALINGSQTLTGIGALALHDTENLLKAAQISSAMTADAIQSSMQAYDPRPHALRGFRGQKIVAQNILALTKGSEIIPSNSGKVQDAYSLRCTPQVIGPSIDAYHYTRQAILTEMNGLVDNPLFFPEQGDSVAAGNFHGQAPGMALDFLAIAVAEIGSLSERHTNRLLNPALSVGLPDFLVQGKGLNSGLMVAQYSAAALVSENKILAHPAVVDSISVSADQEDHVSMGMTSALKVADIIRNVETVVAIELLCAAQAFDFRKPKKPGKGTQAAYQHIRACVSFLKNDRPLHPDIRAIEEIVRDRSLVKAVEGAVGTISI